MLFGLFPFYLLWMDNIAQMKQQISVTFPKHGSRYKQSYLENVQNHPSGRSKHL